MPTDRMENPHPTGNDPTLDHPDAALPRASEEYGTLSATASQAASTGIAPTFAAPAEKINVHCGRVLPGPGQRIDDFELLAVLGEGAFGRVFLARQVSLDRQVALKVTANKGSEARTLASLEHDHIVHVFSEILDQGRDLRLLCMQYVPGTTLQRLLEALRRRPRKEWTGLALLEAIDELTVHPASFHADALRDREMLARDDHIQVVCWMAARLADALDYAHHRGILHRDIKPANILVSQYCRPLLADFNLAFHTEPLAGAPKEKLGGTLAYMAPEHIEAFDSQGAIPPQLVDQRSDIYSLGVVVFEMLTGVRPHPDPKRESSESTLLRELAAQRRGPVPSLRKFNPEVPEVLERVVQRCLDPDPGQRPQTGAELARALDGCREHRRIERELPVGGILTRTATAHPFLMLLLLVFWPHFLGSVVNISYNQIRIVDDLSAAQQRAFVQLVLGYNLVVYPVCFWILYWQVGPVVRLWRRLGEGKEVGPAEMASLRSRVLRMPLWVVALSCLGWLPGGLFFPLAIWLLAGPVDSGVFGHFLVSFALSGLIALTYSFFGTQYIALRILYPRLWVNASGIRETIRREVCGLARRLWIFQLWAGLIPLAGAILMIAVGPEISGYRTFRLLATSLIILGLVGFGLALMMTNFLNQTLVTLTRAASWQPTNWSAYLHAGVVKGEMPGRAPATEQKQKTTGIQKIP